MLSRDELKAALRRIAREEPEFLDELLGSRFLRNPHPPDRAGDRLTVDPKATVSPSAHVELCDAATTIEIGPGTFIDHFAWLRAWGPGIRIGADCTVHQYCMVQGGVTMGDGVRIGAHTLFIATEHNFSRRDVPIFRQGGISKGIKIGSDIYIGSNVVVLDGVTIGDGAVIAAGAVVKRNVPPRAIVGGVPARVLKER